MALAVVSAALTALDDKPGEQTRPWLTVVLRAVLRTYAQILLNRSPVVGAILMLATAVVPGQLAAGVLAVLGALALARALNLSPELIRSGLYSYNALLLGLGGASLFNPDPRAMLLVALAVAASVFVTAAFHSALGGVFNLPALTFPFLALFYLLLAAAPALGLSFSPMAHDPWAATLGLPLPLERFLQSLGALFFLPRVDAGAVVLVGLVLFSRIALVLALMGFALAHITGITLTELPDNLLPLILGYNFMLTAVALGGVWFVPGLSSFLFAAAGVLICGLMTLGLLPFLTWNGVPLLILPFNLTVILLLYAMRQRVTDGRPQSVDFLLGTPEENLNYFWTRLRRFGARTFIRFHAPFLGRWTCTQGVDGSETHRGPWRHAFDFQVTGPDGELFKGQGKSLTDFHCYRLPVLAAASGVVAKVVDGIADNPVGKVNLRDNWGNLVLIYHGPGLYSLTCHLCPGTIKVHEGQPVIQGDQLGLCGNSGRSPTPHIHWQLQATARVGAPTLHAELHEVILEGDQSSLHGTYIPGKGDVVRNIEPQADLAHLLEMPYGEPLRFRRAAGDGGGSAGAGAGDGAGTGGATEEVIPSIDLQGNTLLRSSGGGTLFYDQTDDLFTVFDYQGNRNSALAILQAALSRVPLELSEGLTWIDYLSPRAFDPWWLRALSDLVSPFFKSRGIEMSYRAERAGQEVKILGESLKRLKGGQPHVSTQATLIDGTGIAEVRLCARGAVLCAERVREHDQEK